MDPATEEVDMSRKQEKRHMTTVPEDVLSSIAEGLGRIEQSEHLEEEEREEIDPDLEDDAEFLREDPIAPPSMEQMADMRIEDLAAPAPSPIDALPRMPQERLETRIRLLRQDCPKKLGTIAARNWARYVDGMTLGAYLASPHVEGGRRRARRDVKHDEDHGYIYLQPGEEWQSEMQACDSKSASPPAAEEERARESAGSADTAADC